LQHLLIIYYYQCALANNVDSYCLKSQNILKIRKNTKLSIETLTKFKNFAGFGFLEVENPILVCYLVQF